MNTHGLSNDFLYAVSRVTAIFDNGNIGPQMQSSGTGFFVDKDDKVFFITNRHVVDPEWGEKTKNQNYKLLKLSIDRRVYDSTAKLPKTEELFVKNYKYAFPDNGYDDIACLYEIEFHNEPSLPCITFEYEDLATKDVFQSSLFVCDWLAFIGFPVHQYDEMHGLPIVRSGIVSSDPRVNFPLGGTDKRNVIAYEAFSEGGASGSPVFATQKGLKFGEGIKAPEGFFRPLKLIGINAGHIDDPNFGPNSRISIFYRSDHIIELIEGVDSSCDNKG